jgi:hypothetical protein
MGRKIFGEQGDFAAMGRGDGVEFRLKRCLGLREMGDAEQGQREEMSGLRHGLNCS